MHCRTREPKLELVTRPGEEVEVAPRRHQRLASRREALQPDPPKDRRGARVDSGHRDGLALPIEHDVSDPRQAPSARVVDLAVEDVAREEKLDLFDIRPIGREDTQTVDVHRGSGEDRRATVSDRDARDPGHWVVEPDTEVSESAKLPSAHRGHASSDQVRQEKWARGVARERLRRRRRGRHVRKHLSVVGGSGG
jgi:hypothetical protein